MAISSKIFEFITGLHVGKEVVVLSLVILIAALLLSSYIKQQRHAFYPGLRPLPLIGNVHQIAPHINRFIPWLGEILEEYGGTTHLWLGNNYVVATKDVDLVQRYYSSPQSNANFKKDLFRVFASYGLGDGLLTSDGRQWEFSRKNLAPSFTAAVLKDFIPTFEKRTEKLLNAINVKLDESSTICIAEDLGLCAFLNIAETHLQLQEEDMENPLKLISDIDTMMHLLQQRGFSPWQNPDAFYHQLPSGKLALKTMTQLKSYLESVRLLAATRVEERQLEGKNEWKKKVFINALVENKGFSKKQVIDELATVMSAGTETTANALGFAILALGQYPDIQEKVYEEDLQIQQEIVGRNLEISDLTKYTYLERVIKETLRMFPVIPLYYRHLTADLDCGKHALPAGTELLMHTLDIHRDPKHHPEPEKFDPDRFLPENIARRPPHSYMPFGWGSRICIGQKFSMMAMKIIISSIVRNFHIYNDVPLSQLSLKMNVSLKDANDIRVSLKRR